MAFTYFLFMLIIKDTLYKLFFSYEPVHLLRVETKNMLQELNPYLFDICNDMLQFNLGYSITPSKFLGLETPNLSKEIRILSSFADVIFILKKIFFLKTMKANKKKKNYQK